MKKVLKHIVIPFLAVGISFGLGAIWGDYYLGPLCLSFGFLNAYYNVFGLWQNFLFGFGFAVTYAYIGYINGLYGLAIFMLFVTTPCQIYGIINWIKHKDTTEVEMKSLKLGHGLLLTFGVAAASVLLGFLLSLIPSQNLAFLDSTSQIINIGGLVLGSMRFRESWYVYLINNILDLAIWIVLVTRGFAYSQMTLIMSVMYLVMNIIGIIMWVRIERRQKQNK